MSPRILVLALASFAMATETYVYAGHLASLAQDLEVSLGAAGQLATVFAVTYAISAPLLSSQLAGIDRRRVILLGLGAIAALNLLAAVMPSFSGLIVIRILCGLAAGVVGPAASAAAAALAPPERRGRAMAVVLAGVTLAFVLGIPLGSVAGAFGGWRATFLFAGVMALAATAAIAFVLPPVPAGERSGLASLRVAGEPAVLLPLLLTMVSFAATFTVIAYVGPVVTMISGLEGAGVGVMQAMIGIGSIVGVTLGARNADRPQGAPFLAASFLVSALALSSYSILPQLSLGPTITLLLGLTMIVGAAATFSRTPVIQARLVHAAPEARSAVLALNGSMVFVGQGLGAAVGGLAIHLGGIGTLGALAACLALAGSALALGTGRQLRIAQVRS